MFDMMRKMKTPIVVFFVAVAGAAFGEFKKPPEPKDVPELMVSASGERITTREQWERVRRPEIARTLLEQEYGIRPVERPADLAFAETAAPEECCGGRAIRKRVRATY